MARTIAFFSDAHANLHALQAVLRDIEAQGVKEIACLGDLVGYGAFPNEVVAVIQERGIPCVRGNYDDGVGGDKEGCGCAYTDPRAKELGDRSFAWTKARTTAENKAFLASLPLELRWEVEGWRVLLVHGSPRRINEYLFSDRAEESFRRIARASAADVILFGHTHTPFHKVVEGAHFINVGTAGKPVDGDPRVGYALVAFGLGSDVGASTQNVGGRPNAGPTRRTSASSVEPSAATISPQDVSGALQVEFRKVDYEFEAAAQAIESSGLPQEFAALLRSGGVAHEA